MILRTLRLLPLAALLVVSIACDKKDDKTDDDKKDSDKAGETGDGEITVGPGEEDSESPLMASYTMVKLDFKGEVKLDNDYTALNDYCADKETGVVLIAVIGEGADKQGKLAYCRGQDIRNDDSNAGLALDFVGDDFNTFSPDFLGLYLGITRSERDGVADFTVLHILDSKKKLQSGCKSTSLGKKTFQMWGGVEVSKDSPNQMQSLLTGSGVCNKAQLVTAGDYTKVRYKNYDGDTTITLTKVTP